MSRRVFVIVAFAILAVSVAKLSAADDSAPAKRARMLMVTQSAGFKHGSVTRKEGRLSPAEQTVTELGVASGLYRVDCTQDCEADFTREKLQHYDIVFLYTTGKLPIAESDREYFLNNWLKQPGHGVIGTHSATDTYHNYEPFWDMIGGTFNGHPWNSNAQVTITVHDQEHPLSRPWGDEFTITDEIYQFKHWQPEKVRVLMSMNMAETELKKPYHVPIAWVKEYGKGKVAYISLGHREDVWTNPVYQESLLGGVKWIMGIEKADATPNPKLSTREDKKAKAAVQADENEE